MFIATEHRSRLKWHRGADGMLGLLDWLCDIRLPPPASAILTFQGVLVELVLRGSRLRWQKLHPALGRRTPLGSPGQPPEMGRQTDVPGLRVGFSTYVRIPAAPPMFIATEHRSRLKWHRGADGMLVVVYALCDIRLTPPA